MQRQHVSISGNFPVEPAITSIIAITNSRRFPFPTHNAVQLHHCSYIPNDGADYASITVCLSVCLFLCLTKDNSNNSKAVDI